jgi:hypothetical protein
MLPWYNFISVTMCDQHIGAWLTRGTAVAATAAAFGAVLLLQILF